MKAGQRIADSGNTGRSFAPHLHYELRSSSGKVLDPLKVHGKTHPRLSGADREAFEAERAALMERLQQVAPQLQAEAAG